MAARSARSLIGRAVVSVADDEKVGTISNFQLDLARRTILGLLIGGGTNIINRQRRSFIPLNHVRTFGRGGVTIDDKSDIVIERSPSLDSTTTLDDLKKGVVTTGGEAIGDGDDLVFDDASGAITALQLAPQGGFLGIGATTHVLPIEEVVEFGPDAITVQDAVLARVRAE